MAKRNFDDLLAFVTVARERNFTRAAARLGVTQSALSQTVSALEARLKIRLLTRTTRSVSPTAAGERLVSGIGHRFDEIEAELDALTVLRQKPAGTVRLTGGDHVLTTTVLPKLTPLLRGYPDIRLELDVYNGFRDIVVDRFDAGVRLGDTIDKDMIAVAIGPRLKMAAVATPAYLADKPALKTPHDLVSHNCINMRFPTQGGLYVWEFERRGQALNVRVDGQVTCNTSHHMIQAALSGFGIAFLPEEEFSPHLEAGRLVRVLNDWCAPFPGYYLYYPSRRLASPAFSLVVEALRVGGPVGRHGRKAPTYKLPKRKPSSRAASN